MNNHNGYNPENNGFRKVSSDGIWNSNGRVVRRNGAPNLATAQPIICDLCQDALWVDMEPLQPGLPRRLAPCSCQRAINAQHHHMRTYAGLGTFADRTFDNLTERGRKGKVDPGSFQLVVERARQFATNPTGWVVLSGPVATGKSHIAAAVTNLLTSNDQPAKYVSVMQIEELLHNAAFGYDEESDKQAWKAVTDAPILVLDDLGSQHSNAWIDSRIDQLLTRRAATAAPTFIVLSKPLAALPQRARDRLGDTDLCVQLSITPSANDFGADDVVPPSMLERMTFDTFDPSGAATSNRTEEDSLTMALKAAQLFAASPEKWLYLHGPTGVGKTHLAVAIAAHTTKVGWTPVYWRTPDLLDSLRQTFADDSESSFFDRFASVKDANLLILDDFIPYRMSDWTLEKLYQLICHRYDRLLPTVITSQYIIWEGVEDSRWEGLNGRVLWESIRSRLADTSVVTERLMSAPDYRNRGA